MKTTQNQVLQFAYLLLLWMTPFILFNVTGCSKVKTKIFPVEQFKQPILKGNTYIILGQQIGGGNIERISFALYMNGHALAKSKGVQTPEAAYKDLKTPEQIDFLVTDRSKHAYRIWEIDNRQIKPDGRALLFCHMFGNNSFTWMPASNTKIGRLNAWMAPVEYGKENFFYGIAFTLSRPGIYYLGETLISGSLIEQTDTDKKLISIGDFRRSIRSSPENAKSYLENLRIDTSVFFDMSGKWKKLSWNDLIPYKKGDPAVKYDSP